MMDIFKRPVVLIIVGAAIIIAIVWSYVDKRIADNKTKQAAAAAQQAAQNISNLTNIDPNDYNALVQGEYKTASLKATAVIPGYVFSAMVVELPGSLALNSGNDRFIFSAPKDTANNWTITFSELTGNYIRAAIPKDDYLGSLSPINTNLWKFQYVTAIQIAEKNGGKDFREKNTLTGATLTLKHGDPNNWLTWTVEYDTTSGKFIKQIDANSGKLIENLTTTGDQATSNQ